MVLMGLTWTGWADPAVLLLDGVSMAGGPSVARLRLVAEAGSQLAARPACLAAVGPVHPRAPATIDCPITQRRRRGTGEEGSNEISKFAWWMFDDLFIILIIIIISIIIIPGILSIH